MKKSLSGPDLGPNSFVQGPQARAGYHAIDVESGDRSGSPLSKRHAPSPHGPANGAAGPGPGSSLSMYSGMMSVTPPAVGGSAAARRARSLQAAAGLSYVISSAALILLNKKVLVHYHYSAVHALLFYHCLLAVIIARVVAWMGWGRIEPLTWQVARLWMPVNVIFVAMLATNFYALKTVGVGMVSILKNITNLFIIAGDYFWFRRTYSWQVYACLGLMVLSVFMGGATDAQFSAVGYAWQLVNCVFTAAYALYLSKVTERLTSSGGPPLGGHGPPRAHGRVNELSMSFYNNLLSLPLAFAMMVLTGEVFWFAGQPALRQPSFLAYSTLGGMFGYAISFTSIWYVSVTTATLYSLTGSMNKVLVAVIGIWMFGESTAPKNLASIAIGLAAGGLLPYIKMKQAAGGGGGGGGGGSGGTSGGAPGGGSGRGGGGGGGS